jgi:hypothetical protein
VHGEERPDDLKVTLGLFDERHVTGVLEDLLADFGNIVDEGLDRPRPRLVMTRRGEQGEGDDPVHLVQHRPVAKGPMQKNSLGPFIVK